MKIFILFILVNLLITGLSAVVFSYLYYSAAKQFCLQRSIPMLNKYSWKNLATAMKGYWKFLWIPGINLIVLIYMLVMFRRMKEEIVSGIAESIGR